MDTRDGRIYEADRVRLMTPEDRAYMKPMEVHPTPLQRARGKVGRNDYCPCGSGKKFKKCCLWRAHLDAGQAKSYHGGTPAEQGGAA